MKTDIFSYRKDYFVVRVQFDYGFLEIIIGLQ